MVTQEELENQRKEIIEKTKDIVCQIRDHNEEFTKLDLEQLEKDGIIIKKGAWYLVPNMNNLPESLKFIISEYKEAPQNVGILVKINNKKNPFSKVLKQFEKLGF